MSKTLLITTAVLEAATGLALLVVPSAIVSVLLGAALETPPALVVAHVAGAALVALALACWLGRADPHGRAARGLVAAMLFYNAAAVAVLMHARLGMGLTGLGLWPAAGLHTFLAVWCLMCLAPRRTNTR